MYEGMVFVFGLVFWILGVITIVCAVAIFAGAVVIYLYETRTIGGKIVLVFSVLSMGTGGGLFIGFVLGVLGGYFNITKKWKVQQKERPLASLYLSSRASSC